MNGKSHWLTRISTKSGLGYRDLVALGGLDPYGQHQLLWKFFDLPHNKAAERTQFLFRAELRDGLPLFYVLSRVIPHDTTGKWRIEPKEYRPDLSAGDRFAFKLRANPVSLAKMERNPAEVASWLESREQRELPKKDTTKKRIRHDVVMGAKLRMGWKEKPLNERPPLDEVAREAGVEWLLRRMDNIGCSLNVSHLDLRPHDIAGSGSCSGNIHQVCVHSHQVHHMKERRGAEGKSRGIVLTTLDFEGDLLVTDPDQFHNALLNGIGPAKAFGCGLLMVRRT